MFKWKKLGKIFDPTKAIGLKWLNNFAQCTSTIVHDDYVRVYFSCRPPVDKNGQYVSYTSFVDFDRNDLTEIVNIAEEPILQLGELGTFDEFGVYPSSVVKLNKQIYFFYAGWTRMFSVFANVAIGLAVSDDGGTTFSRLGNGPILSRTLNEPFQVSGPKVRIFNGKWYMFYISGTKWLLNDKNTETIYKIKMATSTDGISWDRDGKEILHDILGEEECQAGPDVFFHSGKYHMYFSYRYGLDFRGNDRGYRIGYAYSNDLINWTRSDDNAGIGLSEEGWDDIDMHYPHVFELDGKWYMLYNGNEFGRYGFGLAIMEK
jgi:predicted GH43/DUF377 family glycosyl hydrolase